MSVVKHSFDVFSMIISKSHLKIIDIIKAVYESKNEPIILNEFTKDFYQYSIISFSEGLKSHTYDDYDPERMSLRLDLYTSGWEPSNIENYLYKHLLKRPYHNTDISVINSMYISLSEQLKLVINKREKIKGRPPLPPLVKDYLKRKQLQKSKRVMDSTYENSKKYIKLKQFLLLPEEIDYIITNIKGRSDIIDKISHLKE